MKKSELINNVSKFIYDNFNQKQTELYDYLYENIEFMAKKFNIDEEFLEDKLVDRDSDYYKKLVKRILREGSLYITIEEKGPFYYIVKLNDINIEKINKYYTKIEYILNNDINNSKGYIYEEFTLLFLKDIGFNIYEHKKTGDGGLDIICNKNIDYILPGVNIQFNLYGQVKFHKDIVSTKYIKQLIKDKLYKVIIEKNSLTECHQTIFISHKGFSEKAKIYAKKNNLILLNTNDIISILLRENKGNSLKFIDKEYIKVKKYNFYNIKDNMK